MGERPGLINVANSRGALTFKVECLVPARVERPSFDLGLESVFLIGQQGDADVRIRRSRQVLGRQIFALERYKKRY